MRHRKCDVAVIGGVRSRYMGIVHFLRFLHYNNINYFQFL